MRSREWVLPVPLFFVTWVCRIRVTGFSTGLWDETDLDAEGDERIGG